MVVMNCGILHWPEVPVINGLPPELTTLIQLYMVPVVAYNIEQDVFWYALTSNFKPRKLPRMHKSVVTAMAFDETGRFLATGGGLGDHTVYVWYEGAVLCALRAHWAWIVQIIFCPRSAYVVTLCDCGIVRVWDRDRGYLMYVADVPARHVSFNRTGTRMILSGYTAQPTTYNTEGEPQLWHSTFVTSIGRVVRTACFDPEKESTYVLYSAIDGFLQIMDNTSLIQCTSAPMASDMLHFAQNCVYLSRCHGELWGYDLNQDKVGYTFYGHTSLVTNMVLRQPYLLSISKDGKICLWNQKNSKLLYVLHFKTS